MSKQVRNTWLAVIAIAIYTILHFDFWWFGKVNPILFGFMPFGFWYPILYGLLGSVLMYYVLKVIWPEIPDDFGEQKEEQI